MQGCAQRTHTNGLLADASPSAPPQAASSITFRLLSTALIAATALLLITLVHFPPKWLVTMLLGWLSLLLFIALPGKQSLLIGGFFFFLPIGLNFNPIFVQQVHYRPIQNLPLSPVDVLMVALLLCAPFAPAGTARYRSSPRIVLVVIALMISALGSMVVNAIDTTLIILSAIAMLKCLLFFVLLPWHLSSPQRFYLALGSLLLTMLPQIAIGVMQQFTGGSLGLEFLGEQAVYQQKTYGETLARITGTLGSFNKLAVYLGMLLPVATALLFAPLRARLKYCAIAPLLVGGVIVDIYTFSRGGWYSLVIGMTLAASWALSKKTGRWFISALLVCSVIIGSATVLIAASPQIRTRLFKSHENATLSRVHLVDIAAAMAKSKPLWGVGYGNFVYAAPTYDRSPKAVSYAFPWPVHNEFLLMLAEIGIPGLILFCILFVTMLIRLLSAIKRSNTTLAFASIGLFCGLCTWFLHQQVEFIHAITTPVFWAYLALCESAVQISRLSVTADTQP